jgi:DNA repair exonuclease SbcCD ATPase subunit
MIDKIIKKHITDEDELKVAMEVFDNMQFTAQPNVMNDFKIKMISLLNFGKHKAQTLTLTPKTTMISGERGKGKTWIMEAFLWAVSGKIRAQNKDVIREGAESASVAVQIENGESTYEIIRTMEGDTNTLVINENTTMICNKIKAGEEFIRAIFGFDLDLIPSLIFFSLKHSFLYTKMLPSEVEKHIIRISNLDAFLELEKRCKEIKNQEKIKIDTIKEMMGTVSEMESEETLKKNIKEKKGIIKTLEEELSDAKKDGTGKISTIEKRRNEIRTILENYNSKTNILKKFSTLKELYNSLAAAIKEQEQLEPERLKAKEIDDKRLELGKIHQEGTEIANQLKKMKENKKGGKCPLLDVQCGELEKSETAITDQITNLELLSNVLRQKYSMLKKEIDASGYEEINKKISAVAARIELIKSQEKALELDLKGHNVEIIKEELKSIQSEDLAKEENTLSEQIQAYSAEQKKVEANVFEIQKRIAGHTADIKIIENNIKRIKDSAEIIEQKDNLEIRQGIFDSLIKQFGKKGIPKTESESNVERFNAKFAEVLESISGKEMTPKFNPDFTLDVEIKGMEGMRNSGITSYGQEHLINVAFMVASAFLLGEEIPAVFLDDILEGQSDAQTEKILTNVTKIKGIKKFVLASSRIPKESATLYLE